MLVGIVVIKSGLISRDMYKTGFKEGGLKLQLILVIGEIENYE
jgi:hypothetical protein